MAADIIRGRNGLTIHLPSHRTQTVTRIIALAVYTAALASLFVALATT